MFVLLPRRGWAVATLMNAGNEMDIPGNPSAMDRTSRNAVDALLGEPVEGTPLRTFYVFCDLVALVLLAAAWFALYRGVRALRRREPPRHRIRAWTGVVARAAGGALLLGAPALLGVGWAGGGSVPVSGQLFGSWPISPDRAGRPHRDEGLADRVNGPVEVVVASEARGDGRGPYGGPSPGPCGRGRP